MDINPKIIRQIESYCAYQDRSRKEVEIKLIQLGALPNQKLSVLIRLELQGFLDDERFAKSFVRGKFKDRIIDNTTPEEIEAWLEALKRIRPSEVMIYTISRDTPVEGQLEKVPLRELRKIATRVKELGIETQVSG